MASRNKQDTKKTIKSGVDVEESRRRREETAVRIRKEKRDETLFKRRNMVAATTNAVSTPDKQATERTNKLKELPTMVEGVYSPDAATQLEAVIQFRKILSIERNPPIEEVIQANVVPRFVEMLTFHDNPQLQFETAWALTNIASGSSEQTRVVIDHGAVPIFIQLLSSPNEEVREQAVWALGNIAGDSPQCRDYVLQNSVMTPLLQNLIESTRLTMLRNATWTLSNLCRGKPQPPFEWVKPALPILARLVYSLDRDVLADACWALSYMSDGHNDKIQAVIETGVCRRLVELLLHVSYEVQTPALRTVGNIVTGDEVQTQVIINVSALPCLLSLLSSSKKSIKKEACWTISNITAGSPTQIQAVIDCNIVPPLVQLLEQAEFDVKKEAAWAISNATSGGSPQQINYLVNQRVIPPLCALFECPDARIINVALEGIENILRAGDIQAKLVGVLNPYLQLVEECDGVDRLEKLQTHTNVDIYRKALSILETFFATEEEDEVLAPNVDANSNTFTFGANANQGDFNF